MKIRSYKTNVDVPILLYIQVYIIDYGLAKKYRDLHTHKHIPYR